MSQWSKTAGGVLAPSDIVPVKAARRIAARYDAAQTTSDNVNHWAAADALSADAAANPAIRKILRNRARYEISNNPYGKGMVLTIANDCVGTGPRLQLMPKDERLKPLCDDIEDKFEAWLRAIGIAAKLRAMRMAKAVDGEAFAIMAANPMLAAPVKLDLKLYEADYVTSASLQNPDEVDGIEYDQWGNPTKYNFLKAHPGGASGSLSYGEHRAVAAKNVIHWYRFERLGQSRGVPEVTPALPLFAQLRRYTLAVIAAAETAADHAAVLYTKSPAGMEAVPGTPFETLEIEKRMMTTLPDGWEMSQLKAEQPTTTYAEFKHEILNEIARCLNIPYNVAAGNSSSYNYASGRLDHQTYYKSIRIEQVDLGCVCLDRLFDRWMDEAVLIENYIKPQARILRHAQRAWFWDGMEHVDPTKESKARDMDLANGSTTHADEYARKGQDWEPKLGQWADEIKKKAALLGLGVSEYLGAVKQTAKVSPKEGNEDE